MGKVANGRWKTIAVTKRSLVHLQIAYVKTLKEDSMGIEFTKDQYEALLRMLYLGSWMVTLSKDEPDPRYDEIEQHLLCCAAKFGFDKFVSFDTEEQRYYVTEEFEEKTDVIDVIRGYNMYIIWEELMLTLARRDLVRQYGADKVAAMSEEEMVQNEYPFLAKYEEEFRENGLENLILEPKIV
jgi:hypothetical protein